MAMHLSTLTHVKIQRPVMWHARLFTDVFNALSNLSHLTLDNCQMSECDAVTVDCDDENFPNLRHLTIVNCDPATFRLFRYCKVRFYDWSDLKFLWSDFQSHPGVTLRVI